MTKLLRMSVMSLRGRVQTQGAAGIRPMTRNSVQHDTVIALAGQSCVVNDVSSQVHAYS